MPICAIGIGYSLHAGQVIVADGTPEAAKRIERVLTTNPGMSVVRHVDAGYEEAIEFARENGVKIPILRKINFENSLFSDYPAAS